jgi:hypothetical protein
MSGRDGVHWHCPNLNCNWSFVATIDCNEKTAPQWVCGSVRKKGEEVPAFQSPDFLRKESAIKEETGVAKERIVMHATRVEVLSRRNRKPLEVRGRSPENLPWTGTDCSLGSVSVRSIFVDGGDS